MMTSLMYQLRLTRRYAAGQLSVPILSEIESRAGGGQLLTLAIIVAALVTDDHRLDCHQEDNSVVVAQRA
jgi:hypothetical protein